MSITTDDFKKWISVCKVATGNKRKPFVNIGLTIEHIEGLIKKGKELGLISDTDKQEEQLNEQ